MSNWFVALPFAGELPRRLAPPPGVRWLDARDLHLTVAFLGPCGEARALRAWNAVVAELARDSCAPVTVSFGSVGAMGSPRRFSALAARIEVGRDGLRALLGRVAPAALAAAELPPDPREPEPHLTIARLSRSAGRRERDEALEWAGDLDLSGVRASFDALELWTSAEAGADRRYRSLARLQLARGTPPA